MTQTKVTLAVGLFAALLSGCGGIDPEFHVDNSFTVEERAALETAAGAMSEHTGRVCLRLVFDGDTGGGTQRLVRAVPDDGSGVELDGLFQQKPGDERAIYLRPGLSHTRFFAVALHELGHFYGMEHHNDSPGIMNGKTNDTVWTDADRLDCSEHCR